MTITLNHTIVPARDKIAGARFFARIFGLKRGRADHFAPVKVNKSLTLLLRRRRLREPSSRFPCQQPRIRRHPAPHHERENRLRQRAMEPRRRQAQQLERRPRRLFPRSERTRARTDDRAAVTPSFPGALTPPQLRAKLATAATSPAARALHRAGADAVQGFLAQLNTQATVAIHPTPDIRLRRDIGR